MINLTMEVSGVGQLLLEVVFVPGPVLRRWGLRSGDGCSSGTMRDHAKPRARGISAKESLE